MWSSQGRYESSSLRGRQLEFFNLATDELLRRQRILWCAILCAFLNLADMLLSLHLFSQFEGLEEGNPLMRAALAVSDSYFIAWKMTLGNVGILVLYVYARRKQKLAERGLYFVTAVFCSVVCLSLLGLYFLSHSQIANPEWFNP